MKKVLYFAGALALAATVFITTKNTSAAENTNLNSISTFNKANAECRQQGDIRDSGHCYELTQNCYWGTNSMPPCDPWAM